jgi:hypothetical protein
MTRHDHKEPLYRKVNTRARGVHHKTGGDYRHDRNSRRELNNKVNEVKLGSMHGYKKRGLDYTPLLRFLLSKVGTAWAPVRAEAVSRLDQEAPLYWLVARTALDQKAVVCIGGTSFYNGLFVDSAGQLAKVDPDLQNVDLSPTCGCCTHTFNGEPLIRKYKPPQ